MSPSLAALRLECSSLLADALALDISGADLLPSLTDAISFYAYPDAAPALQQLAAAGLKLAVVANWDISLHDVLARVGLDELLRRPSSRQPPSVPRSPTASRFAVALERLGVEASQCVHVGDDPGTDIAGAEAAGISAAPARPQRRHGRLAARPLRARRQAGGSGVTPPVAHDPACACRAATCSSSRAS